MKRAVVAWAAFVAAAAVGLAVWVGAGSNGPRGFASPQAAVRAACHGQASLPSRTVPNDQLGPVMYASYLRALRRSGTFKVLWVNAGPALRFADVRRTRAGTYRVVACYSSP